jgi:hypothetical protein
VRPLQAVPLQEVLKPFAVHVHPVLMGKQNDVCGSQEKMGGDGLLAEKVVDQIRNRDTEPTRERGFVAQQHARLHERAAVGVTTPHKTQFCDFGFLTGTGTSTFLTWRGVRWPISGRAG